jgi:group I intron endonuclease
MKKYNFVYLTTNLINGKQYIGDHSTNNLNDSYLGSGKLTLIPAIKKYGKENFKREILEFFETKEEAFLSQKKYIKQFGTLTPEGYNISPAGGSEISGGIVSEETKIKISKAKTGIKFSEKHKENLRKSHMGLKQKPETVKKRILKTSGMNRSDEFREKLRISKSEETKKKIRNSLSGKSHTEERRQKISISQKNRWKDPEERKKQSNRLKGIKISSETKNKISISLKGRSQKKIKCPYCEKEGGTTMHRWHFENCKFKN